MTRKKTLTAVLFMLSAIVWGTIAWKVYSAMHEEEAQEPRVLIRKRVKKEPSVALLLNYRDPFLGGYSSGKIVEAASKREHLAPKPHSETPSKSVVDEIPPNFQYKGVMRIGKEIKALVWCNGQIQMVKQKEKLDDCSIKTITEKSITVTRKNKSYTIPLS